MYTVFQSAGRIWGFWNPIRATNNGAHIKFQSAGRIWGFWNLFDLLPHTLPIYSFNPPGGFGAFGTSWRLVGLCLSIVRFQSAGRIWGFWNSRIVSSSPSWLVVSIRRADLGLLEPR